ncbi:MAG: 16S rRNA (cytosine(967)-C(5))-methyltransferase RsmB, partial [Clostridia bacterium]
ELRYIISKFAKGRVKCAVMTALEIGVYCLKYLSIPTYAVVNDVVELSKITGKRYIVGFVNATLKSIASAIQSDEIVYPTDKKEYLSIKYSYPMWALNKLIKDYGESVAEDIISYRLPTYNTVRVNTDKISTAEFCKLLEECNLTYYSTIFPDAFNVVGKINIDSSLFTNQSLSSMIVCKSLSCVGKCSVLDVCGAPGGKSVYIAQLNKEAKVTSCDIHPHRVQLIESYAQRLGVELTALCMDATEFNADFAEKFDYVLCDAPCSGFGVLDTKPDIKLFRSNEDIGSLIITQSAILDNCCKYVKKGGTLIYSTCTVFANENGDRIKKFLLTHQDFALSTININQLPDVSTATKQFLPYKDGVQGFYIAKMVKKG